MKAETVPVQEKEDTARKNLIRPKTPPDRTEGLNGMEDKVDEDEEDEHDFWKKEEKEQKRQNEEVKKRIDQKKNEEREKEAEDDKEMKWYERHGLSQEATEEIEEEGEEGREAEGLTSPMIVTSEMRDKHDRAHTPFRSWCRFCVMVRASNTAHHKNKDSEDDDKLKVPRISMDYFFMSKKDEEEKKNPVLVVLNEKTNEKYARAAGQKGIGTEGAVQWLVKDVAAEMRTWGHQGGTGGKIIMKSVGGKSIVALRDAIAKFHG